VIDEVHMLSTSAFNAMLKTLEEPPEHIKFILATTDPQKIPVTVLSRCLQFNLKQMPPGAIAGHLERIAGEEKVAAEPAALRLLAHAARGSMRDALSLLDQAIAFSAGEVGEEAVRGMLGTVDRSHLFRILDALVGGDGAAAIAVADEMEGRSISFDGALQELGTLLHRIALAQVAPAALSPDEPDAARVAELAAAIDPETVQLFYQIALHGRADLPLAPDEYAGFTMALMRMLAFRPGQGGAQQQATAAPARPLARTAAPVQRPAPPATQAGEAARGIAAPARSGSAVQGFDGDWPALVRTLRIAGLAKQLADRSELAAHADGRFELRLPASSKHLAERAYVDKLKAALAERLGGPVGVTVTLGDVAGKTVAAQEEGVRRTRLEEAEATVHADAFVRDLVENFDATIDSIKPVQ